LFKNINVILIAGDSFVQLLMYFSYVSSVIDAFGLSFPRIGSLRWTCTCSIKMY